MVLNSAYLISVRFVPKPIPEINLFMASCLSYSISQQAFSVILDTGSSDFVRTSLAPYSRIALTTSSFSG